MAGHGAIMSDADTGALMGATGADTAGLYLEGMVRHRQGAIRASLEEHAREQIREPRLVLLDPPAGVVDKAKVGGRLQRPQCPSSCRCRIAAKGSWCAARLRTRAVRCVAASGSHHPVTLFGAHVLLAQGWTELEETFRWLASRFSQSKSFDVELIAAGVSGDLAYTVGFEHSQFSLDGVRVPSATLRATLIYRREDGE